MKLQQEMTIREWQFEQFSAILKDMSDQALESKFVCRLKEDIQSEMMKLNPMGEKAVDSNDAERATLT